MRRTAIVIAGLLCGPAPATSFADGEKPLRLEIVEALARTYYSSLEVFHATSSDPDAPNTPLMSSLKNCQLTRQRRLSHAGFRKFFASKRFFASSCADGSFAVISVDRSKRVRLVALSPSQRLAASAWDENVEDQILIAGPSDVCQYASAYIFLKYQVKVPEAEFTVKREPGSAYYKGTQNYVATSTSRRVRRQLKSYTITLGSRDGKKYSLASTQISYD